MLRATGVYTDMPSAQTRLLDRFAEDQLQRVLSARSHLRRIAAIAAREDWTVVVLKGAAEAARGSMRALVDVDVLAPPAVAADLWNELNTGTLAPGETGYHFATIAPPHGIQIDVHHAAIGFPGSSFPFDRTVEIPGYKPLRMLRPADHVWLYLNQAVRPHPDRIYCLRDVLQLKSILERFDAIEQERLDELISASKDASAFNRALRFADPSVPVDRRYRRLYLLTARSPELKEDSVKGRLWQRASGITVGGTNSSWHYNASKWAHLGGPLHRFALRVGLQIAATAFAWVATIDHHLMPMGEPTIGAE